MSKESELCKQLSEMFQLDRGDLDFGIYRIMNQKLDGITQFLEKQLGDKNKCNPKLIYCFSSTFP